MYLNLLLFRKNQTYNDNLKHNQIIVLLTLYDIEKILNILIMLICLLN